MGILDDRVRSGWEKIGEDQKVWLVEGSIVKNVNTVAPNLPSLAIESE